MKINSKNFVIDGLDTKVLAKKYSTPLYCYSFNKIKENITKFTHSFKELNPIICFAVKANTNKTLLGEINKLGLGADVVSIGELTKAIKSGINPKKIVFSGVGKTADEISFAIKKRISYWFDKFNGVTMVSTNPTLNKLIKNNSLFLFVINACDISVIPCGAIIFLTINGASFIK